MEAVVVILLFITYGLILFETQLKINKSVAALLGGSVAWILYALLTPEEGHALADKLTGHFGSIAGVLIFLLGAMTIVELVDLHQGFSVITHRIRTHDAGKLMWITCGVAFGMSAVLDNLATAIVMVTLLRKVLPRGEVRQIMAALVVVAANAGGAWSPIGDVTTTLLWVGGQVSAGGIVFQLLFPCVVCMVVPVLIARIRLRGAVPVIEQMSMAEAMRYEHIRGSKRMLFSGVGSLILVPVIKTFTGLPPFIGILFGLAFVCLMSETIHWQKSVKERQMYSVSYALSKVDVSAILYFMGILLLVYMMEEVNVLSRTGEYLRSVLPGLDLLVILVGLISAIIDNGSLVAAMQAMFSLQEFPMDSRLWEFTAYCAGTGGSLIILGSAAGIAVMNMEKISVGWYVKRISLLALAGYFSGIVAYQFQKILVTFFVQ
ncbi:MAG: sodium:proton antiporter NhaD [Flavobacteriales bacterium]|nr:sodium:proton antiporter NhaD [Flavobacteriales bacterium]